MGTTIGGAIDYLVAGLPPVLQAVDPNVLVADNLPAQVPTTSLVVIGRGGLADGETTVGTLTWYEIGAQRMQEAYTIPCNIQTVQPGPAQKPARDAAIALYNATLTFLRSDLTFGGLLQRGRIGMTDRFQLDQTQSAADATSGGNRTAVIDFSIAVQNLYIP